MKLEWLKRAKKLFQPAFQCAQNPKAGRAHTQKLMEIYTTPQ